MKIAIIGTGLMGSAMAEGFMTAGNEVVVYNRTLSKTYSLEKLGAKVEITAAEAIHVADAVIFVLSDGAGVLDMLKNKDTLGALKGKMLLNASTTGINEITEIESIITENGGCFAETSIMVGATELRTRQAYFMLGCKAENETFWTEVLSSLGTTQRVGSVGDATKAEAPIVFASLFSSVMTAYAGASLVKFNIPTEIAMATIGGMLPGGEYMLPKLLERNYDECMASTDSLIGVADAAISTATNLGMQTKVLKDMRELFVTASNKGYGSKDATSIMEVIL